MSTTRNICQYIPIPTISKKELDERFGRIYREICYLQAIIIELTTTTTTSTTTSTTTTHTTT